MLVGYVTCSQPLMVRRLKLRIRLGDRRVRWVMQVGVDGPWLVLSKLVQNSLDHGYWGKRRLDEWNLEFVSVFLYAEASHTIEPSRSLGKHLAASQPRFIRREAYAKSRWNMEIAPKWWIV